MRRLLCLLALLSLSTLTWAQGTTSRIAGVVTDSTGAVVAGATVTATNEATNVSYTTKTSSAGTYVFDSLQIGTYTIAAEYQGFKKFVSKGNILSIGLPTTVNVALQIGSTGETVEVKGGYDLVQTESSGNFGNVVDNTTLKMQPIVQLRSRSPLAFVYLQPGVQDGGSGQTGGGVSVHGSRDRAWNYVLDGIDVNESTSGGSNTTPTQTNPDSITEFRVLTANFTAEYGRSSGGQVTMITTSGSNRFHGGAFWFYQGSFLQANAADNKAWQKLNNKPNERPQFVQNIPGFSVGGPIRKNKDFFFVNMQFLHAVNSYLQTSTVYTDSARQGLWRYNTAGRNGPFGSANAVVDQNGNPLPGVNYATYNIAANDPTKIGLDPAIQKYLGLEPSANTFSVGDGFNIAGYTFTAQQLEKQVNLTVKIDHTFSPTSSIFVRWYSGHQNTFGDVVNGGLPYFPGNPNVVDTRRKPRNAAINWRWNPTPRITNELVVGDSYFGYEFVNPDPNLGTTPPFIFSNISVPLSSWVNNNRYANTMQLVDNFTVSKGAHTLKAGINFRYLREIDHRGSIGNFNAEPQVTFSSSLNPVNATLYNVPTNINTKYDRGPLLQGINELLGRIGDIQQGYVAQNLDTWKPARSWNIMDHRWPEYDFYFQDSWKLRPNLVVDAGLRWEIRMAPHMASFANLVPNQSVLFGETPTDNIQFVPGKFYSSDWNNVSPSLGIAWDPTKDGKTSVRANFRVAYDRINPFSFSSSVFQGMPGLTYQMDDTASGQDTVVGTVVTPGMRAQNWAIPPVPAGKTPQSLTVLPAYATTALTVADPNMQSPKVYEWGLSIQRELMRNTVFSLSYIGNKGVHLYGGYDANQVNFTDNGFLSAFKVVQGGGDSPLFDTLLAPYPDYQTYAGKHATDPTNYPCANASCWALKTGFPSNFSLNSVAGLANTLANYRVSGVTPLTVVAGLGPYFFKPFPQELGGMFVLGTRDYSYYNGMEAQLERRFSNGLLFSVNWTWSRTLDVRSFDPAFTRVATGSSQSASATPYDFHNPRLNYGPADFDRTHMVRTNWVYELPFGKGQKLLSSTGKLLDQLVGGWEFAGNANWETGRPITFYSGSYTFSGDVMTPVSCAGCSAGMGHRFFNSTINQYFFLTPLQKATLFIPAPGEPSNLGRNWFRQGRIANLNMTVAKRFHITESQTLQARLEMQNVTNSQMFDTFGSQNLQSSLFTRMNEAYDGIMNGPARRMQLSLKYTF